MTIPILFGYPSGAPAELAEFLSTVQTNVNAKPKITVVAPTVHELLTGEYMQ